MNLKRQHVVGATLGGSHTPKHTHTVIPPHEAMFFSKNCRRLLSEAIIAAGVEEPTEKWTQTTTKYYKCHIHCCFGSAAPKLGCTSHLSVAASVLRVLRMQVSQMSPVRTVFLTHRLFVELMWKLCFRLLFFFFFFKLPFFSYVTWINSDPTPQINTNTRLWQCLKQKVTAKN